MNHIRANKLYLMCEFNFTGIPNMSAITASATVVTQPSKSLTNRKCLAIIFFERR